MTLSLAWKSEGRIHLASDSRIKLGGNQYADIGIKVLSIPILVVGTELDEDGMLRHLFESRYGFCYAGSLVNASTLKELLEEVLRGIQYVGDPQNLSFEAICEVVKSYSSHISTELCAYLAENGKYEFFLAGFCPQKKRLQAAQFSLEHVAGQAMANFTAILGDDGSFVAIGTGEAAFKDEICKVNMMEMLLALNRVIDNQAVYSVGGDIQYGSFDSKGSFSISGIARISSESALVNDVQYGPTIVRRHKYRGFEPYKDWKIEENPLWVSLSFIELEVPTNDESLDAFMKISGIFQPDR